MEKDIIFGMPTLIEKSSARENAELCARLGLRFVELNMNLPEYQVPEIEKTDALRALAEEMGIFWTIHLDENLNIADFNPLVAEAYRETVRRTIRLARELKAPVINMHLHHGIYITLPDRKVMMYERNRKEYLEAFRLFREMCEETVGDSPIRITVENTDGFREYEKETVELLLDSPVFGLTWDIGHSRAVKEKDEPFLMAHEENLTHFHIHDGTAEPPRNHLALGDGEIDLDGRLDLARKHGCRCVLETKTVDALEKSVAWLKERGRM